MSPIAREMIHSDTKVDMTGGQRSLAGTTVVTHVFPAIIAGERQRIGGASEKRDSSAVVHYSQLDSMVGLTVLASPTCPQCQLLPASLADHIAGWPIPFYSSCHL